MVSNNRQYEQLSALMDGELDPNALQDLLDDLQRDPQLQQAWQGYYRSHDLLHGHSTSLLGSDFRANLGQALRDEPTVLAPPEGSSSVSRLRRRADLQRLGPTWLRPVAGVAIAASVALVSFIGLRSLQDPVVGDAGLQVAAPAQQVILVPRDEPSFVAYPSNGTHWDVNKSEMEQLLNSYLATHTEHAPLGGGVQGVVPYSRIVGYDLVRP